MSKVFHPNSLPSYTDFYGKFWTASSKKCTCKDIWSQYWENDLKGKLDRDRELRGMEEMIANAYCCAHTLMGKEQYKDAPCHFFYYWVGDNFLKSTGNRDLEDFMKEIYETLKEAPYNHKCEIKYDADVNWDLFKQMKEVYDFFYDYSTIQSNAHQYDTKDGSEYSKYLRRISGACIVAKAQCPHKPDHPYCAWFNGKKGKEGEDYCGKELSELRTRAKPNPNPNPNQAGSSGSFSDSEDCKLENFPSKEKYNRFDVGVKCSEEDMIWKRGGTVETNVKNALKPYGKIGGHIDNIVNAWCYVYNGRNGRNMNGPVYDLFYYWLGNKVWGSVSHSNPFSKIMGEIYGALGSALTAIDRGLICTDITQEHFGPMKTLFDYSLDYATIEGCIGKSQTSGSNCTEGYSDYLQRAAEAYEKMEDYCGPGKNLKGICCTYFKKISNKSDGSNIPKPSELKSKLDHVQKPTVLEAETISPPTTTSNTPAAVSSAAALIGIPALAFYLYKYNHLPPGIKNFFGGGSNRKKRSAIRRNFDTLTEYATENGSTIGPTEYSTDASKAESIDNSSIYDEQPRRGRTNNKQGHRNISYQNM